MHLKRSKVQQKIYKKKITSKIWSQFTNLTQLRFYITQCWEVRNLPSNSSKNPPLKRWIDLPSFAQHVPQDENPAFLEPLNSLVKWWSMRVESCDFWNQSWSTYCNNKNPTKHNKKTTASSHQASLGHLLLIPRMVAQNEKSDFHPMGSQSVNKSPENKSKQPKNNLMEKENHLPNLHFAGVETNPAFHLGSPNKGKLLLGM